MLSEQFAHFFANNKYRRLAVFGVILYLKTVVTIFFYYYYVCLKGSFCYFQIPWIIFLFTNVIFSWHVFFFSISMDNLIQFTKRVFRSSHKRQRCRDNKELKIVIVNKQLTVLRSLFVHPCGRICTKQHTVCSWLHTWQLPSFLHDCGIVVFLSLVYLSYSDTGRGSVGNLRPGQPFLGE